MDFEKPLQLELERFFSVIFNLNKNRRFEMEFSWRMENPREKVWVPALNRNVSRLFCVMQPKFLGKNAVYFAPVEPNVHHWQWLEVKHISFSTFMEEIGEIVKTEFNFGTQERTFLLWRSKDQICVAQGKLASAEDCRFNLRFAEKFDMYIDLDFNGNLKRVTEVPKY